MLPHVSRRSREGGRNQLVILFLVDLALPGRAPNARGHPVAGDVHPCCSGLGFRLSEAERSGADWSAKQQLLEDVFVLFVVTVVARFALTLDLEDFVDNVTCATTPMPFGRMNVVIFRVGVSLQVCFAGLNLLRSSGSSTEE